MGLIDRPQTMYTDQTHERQGGDGPAGAAASRVEPVLHGRAGQARGVARQEQRGRQVRQSVSPSVCYC
jgi:hypothetical protein